MRPCLSKLLTAAALLLVAAVQPAAAEDATRSVKVNGTAVAKVKPDLVVWTVTITNHDLNLRAAREANDQSAEQVIALRDAFKIDPQDVQSGYLSIRKVFERDRSGNQGAFRHYSVQRTIVLQLRDTSQFDLALQKLTAIDHIEVRYALKSTRYHEVRRDTRLKAVSLAKDKASAMTTALGAKLGHVLNIDETVSNQDAWRGSYASNAVFNSGPVATADDIEGTFAPGSIEIRVSVAVEFAIE